MRVRLRQRSVEARQWDGDLDGMIEWLKKSCPDTNCERERVDATRLRVNSFFSFSLAEGDWLVMSGVFASKVYRDDFDGKYERAGIHDPIEGWTPMVQAQHELTVMIPGMLSQMGKENWTEFCEWLVMLAQDTAKDPQRAADSIG